jgi:hypothetical protein
VYWLQFLKNFGNNMDDKTASALFGIAAPLVQKITSSPDTSVADARMSALEQDNQNYQKQLDDMKKNQVGQTGMKKGGRVAGKLATRGYGKAR